MPTLRGLGSDCRMIGGHELGASIVLAKADPRHSADADIPNDGAVARVFFEKVQKSRAGHVGH